MPATGLQLRSLIKDDNTLQLYLKEVDVPDPGTDEVLISIEASPINPSDLFLLLGPADPTAAKVGGTPDRPVVTLDIPPKLMRTVAARVGQSMPVGNEGAGTVIAAGPSEPAQALLGKVVSTAAGAMYSHYRCVKASQCLPLAPGTTAAEGASAFVNPLTALAMIETMRAEGHKAIVHTAAASNLGQMLNRLCINEGIDLVNIVRKPEQEKLLRDLGAKIVCNSSDGNFMSDLTEALVTTEATIAFDAIGGGQLGSHILTCMEAAATRNAGYNHYGSEVFKQLYIYGALDMSPTLLTRNYGFSWGVGGFLLIPFLKKVGPEKSQALRAKVAAEIKTTFASHYAHEVSLIGALSIDAIQNYAQRATGEKYLVRPQA